MPISEPSGAARPVRGWSIRHRLIVLVLFATVPMLVLSVAVVQKLAQSERVARRQAITYSARSIQTAVDSQLEKLIAIGRTLSVSPSLGKGELAAFRREAEQAVQDLKGVWILVADPNGQQVFNVVVPPDETPPRRSPEAIATQTRAFENKKPEVSNVFSDAYRKLPTVTVEVPVFRDGAPLYCVAVIIDVSHFLDLLSREHTPEGWLTGIVDRRGLFIARSLDHERWVAQPASAGWRVIMNREGVFEFPSLEGDVIVQANTVSPLSGWAIGVAANKDTLESSVRHTMWEAALAGATIALLSLMMAALIARTIARPIEMLEKSAGAADKTQGLRDGGTGVPEIDRAIHARFLAESRLQESQARLRLAVTSAAMGIHVWDVDTGQLEWDGRVREIWGIGPDVIPTYETFITGLHTDDRAQTQAAIKRALDPTGDGKYAAEYRVRPLDGSPERWVRATGLVYFEAGRAVRLVGTVRDITERKQAEERQALLTQEIAHRGKNLLAVIQSIAGQILSNARSPEEAKDALLRRMQSLSRTYNTLTGSAWEGAEISKLVHDELGPFVAQAEISGPQIKVPPKAAQTLALAIHELATNAAKYGALSVPRGGVSVRWSIEGDPGDQTFSFRWQERGGPPVQSPTRRGFGALITDHVVAFEFGTKPLHEYAADGVRYEFTAALSNVAGLALPRNPGTKSQFVG